MVRTAAWQTVDKRSSARMVAILCFCIINNFIISEARKTTSSEDEFIGATAIRDGELVLLGLLRER
jgi:hypothetical protein